MATFIEMMKEYVENARARVAVAEQAHRLATAELQAANTDFAIWNNAYTLALKEKERWQAGAPETQLPMELPGAANPEAEQPEAAVEEAPLLEINKTEKVREVLREHANGATPAQLWIEVKDVVVSRPYLYSVLKRLRDNDEVAQRRGGKYVLKSKPAEVKPDEMEGMTLQ